MSGTRKKKIIALIIGVALIAIAAAIVEYIFIIKPMNNITIGKTIYIDFKDGTADYLEMLLQPENGKDDDNLLILLDSDAVEQLIQYMRDNHVKIVSGVYKIPQTSSYEEIISILEFMEDIEQAETTENDIPVSGETISEENVSLDIASGEGSEAGENPVTVDAEERNYNNGYAEPDPQDTFMLCVEGNISANQAWVDFLKGEMPDYTGVDFSSGRYSGLGRPYTLQDMEGYSLDLWAYGQTEYVEDGGILTDIQIFPYDVDADEEEELLFVCKSYAGLVKLWVLDEAYEDTWLLYPSTSNWTPPGDKGRAWLWSDGFICKQDADIYIENCPDGIYIFRIGEGLAFKLECNQYWSSDTTAVYYLDYEEEDGWSTVKVMFNRNGVVTDGSLIYAENVCAGPAYDDDLSIITQIYEETVGDAVPVRELTGLDGTEDGVMIVTREEFYSGAYLE